MIFLTCSKHLSRTPHDFLLRKPHVPITSQHLNHCIFFCNICCWHTTISGIRNSFLNHLFVLKSNIPANLPASLSHGKYTLARTDVPVTRDPN